MFHLKTDQHQYVFGAPKHREMWYNSQLFARVKMEWKKAIIGHRTASDDKKKKHTYSITGTDIKM